MTGPGRRAVPGRGASSGATLSMFAKAALTVIPMEERPQPGAVRPLR